MLRILLGLVLGAAVGALMGWKSKCAGGGCPLTGNPWTGGIYGAVLGIMLASAFNSRGGEISDEGSNSNMIASPALINLGGAEDFSKIVLESNLPVLVDFWAPWCAPCRMQGKVLDQIAPEIEGKALIVKINVDDIPQLAGRFGVSGIPTLMVFKNGQPAYRASGVQTELALKKALGLDTLK